MWRYGRYSVCCGSKILTSKRLASGHVWDFCQLYTSSSPHIWRQISRQTESALVFHPKAAFSPAAVSNWHQVVMCWNNRDYLTLFLWLTLLQKCAPPLQLNPTACISAFQSFVMLLAPWSWSKKSLINREKFISIQFWEVCVAQKMIMGTCLIIANIITSLNSS